MRLSDKETERRIDWLLGYIIRYKIHHDGVAPSYDEMAEALGISKCAAHAYTRKLEEEGAVRIRDGLPRTIEVVGGKWGMPSG